MMVKPHTVIGYLVGLSSSHRDVARGLVLVDVRLLDHLHLVVHADGGLLIKPVLRLNCKIIWDRVDRLGSGMMLEG